MKSKNLNKFIKAQETNQITFKSKRSKFSNNKVL